MTLARVTELTSQLGQHKRLAVGATSPLSPFPERSVTGNTVTFKAAVTAIWTWYSEQMRHDLQFLLARATYAEKSTLGDFKRLLDDQRHFNEHADYDRAKEALAWRDAQAGAGAPSDRDLVEALFVELEGALETLCQVAGRVRQDQLGTEAWRNHVAVSPESEMLAVLADIGRDAIDERRLAYAVRRFTGHRALNRARTPADRARVAAVIALEINLEPLSVQYDRILDEFGLIGDPMGHALLIIAHGVEAAGYTGDRLMEVLRMAWPEIRPITTSIRPRSLPHR
jgi:hypothetical protein